MTPEVGEEPGWQEVSTATAPPRGGGTLGEGAADGPGEFFGDTQPHMVGPPH